MQLNQYVIYKNQQKHLDLYVENYGINHASKFT